MEQYGEFLESIKRLTDNLGEVRAVWTDQTAKSYDVINENMEFYTKQIWDCYKNAIECCDLVKANYNESEFEDEVSQLAAKCASV